MAGFLDYFNNSIAAVVGTVARSRNIELRNDSLMVHTMISSGTHYIPQDVRVLAALIGREMVVSRRANPSTILADPRLSLKQFAESRAVSMRDLRVEKSAKLWKVSLTE